MHDWRRRGRNTLKVGVCESGTGKHGRREPETQRPDRRDALGISRGEALSAEPGGQGQGRPVLLTAAPGNKKLLTVEKRFSIFIWVKKALFDQGGKSSLPYCCSTIKIAKRPISFKTNKNLSILYQEYQGCSQDGLALLSLLVGTAIPSLGLSVPGKRHLCCVTWAEDKLKWLVMFKQRIKTFISPHEKKYTTTVIKILVVWLLQLLKSFMTIFKLPKNVIKIFRESDIKQLIQISWLHILMKYINSLWGLIHSITILPMYSTQDNIFLPGLLDFIIKS